MFVRLSRLLAGLALAAILAHAAPALAVVGDLRITDSGKPLRGATVSLFVVADGKETKIAEKVQKDEDDDDRGLLFLLPDGSENRNLIVQVARRDGSVTRKPLVLARDGSRVTVDGQTGYRVPVDVTAAPGDTVAGTGDRARTIVRPTGLQLEVHTGIGWASTDGSFTSSFGGAGAGGDRASSGGIGFDFHVPVGVIGGRGVFIEGIFGGDLFAGIDSTFAQSDIHPAAGVVDTLMRAERNFALRLGLMMTMPLFPFLVPCGPAGQCVDFSFGGGPALLNSTYEFETDESGGGGVRNVKSEDRTELTYFGRAMLTFPICVTGCGVPIRGKFGIDVYRASSERLDLTTPAVGPFDYSASFDPTWIYNVFFGVKIPLQVFGR